MVDQQRVCRVCGSTDFWPGGRCRPCRAAYVRERMRDPDVRERAQAAGRRFWAKPDTKAKRAAYLSDPAIKKRHRSYVAKHRAKPETKAKWNDPEAKTARNAKARAYWNQPENKARRAAWFKEYSAKPEIKARKTSYEREQRKTDAYRAWFKAYMAKRYRSSTKLRVHRAMTGSVYKSLRHEKGGRAWESLVGYTREDLMRHLERQFVRGMTWENHGLGDGKWHIDHIVPVVAFSFETAEDPEFQACWGLVNLRPLWSGDNIRKGGHRTHLL